MVRFSLYVCARQDELEEEHWISSIRQLARENDINIVAGTVVELGTHPNDAHADPDARAHGHDHAPLYNTAYCISRHGTVAGRHTKRNLWHPERQTLTAGKDETHNHDVVFPLDTRRGFQFYSSLAICVCRQTLPLTSSSGGTLSISEPAIWGGKKTLELTDSHFLDLTLFGGGWVASGTWHIPRRSVVCSFLAQTQRRERHPRCLGRMCTSCPSAARCPIFLNSLQVFIVWQRQESTACDLRGQTMENGAAMMDGLTFACICCLLRLFLCCSA